MIRIQLKSVTQATVTCIVLDAILTLVSFSILSVGLLSSLSDAILDFRLKYKTVQYVRTSCTVPCAILRQVGSLKLCPNVCDQVWS